MPTATRKRQPQQDRSEPDLNRLFDRLPPHSIEAEVSLLGSMILDSDCIGDVMQLVRDSDFFKPAHGAIYTALVGLYDKHGKLDNVLLNDQLRDQGELGQIGGSDYLIDLAESVPSAVHAGYYARIVRNKARLRALIAASSEIIHAAFTSPDEPDEIVDRAEQAIFNIAGDDQASEPEAIDVLLDQAWAEIEQRQEHGGALAGLDTGFHDLNERLGGLRAGDMIVLAARPSMGKTAFALNMAEHIALDCQQPVAIFSLEMGKQQLAERLMCSRARVDLQKLRRNYLSGPELEGLQATVGEIRSGPLYIDDTPGLSVVSLRAKARRLVARHGIQVIFIDYLQLASVPGAESRLQEVSEISRAVKALARELNIPVIVLSQLNRKAEGRQSKRPMLSDLRESGSIEQDADVVMMLHRADYYRETGDSDETPDADRLAEVIVAKQRNGPTDTVKLAFFPSLVRFDNLANAADREALHSLDTPDVGQWA